MQKILIVGAGAIGGSLACYLSSAGCDVTVAERSAELAAHIDKNGVKLDLGKKGRLSASVRAADMAALEDGTFDICFCATRAYSLKAAATSALPKLKPGALVVSMNNGICIDALRETVGDDRAVGCSINYGAGIAGPGSYFIKIHGGLEIGMAGGQQPERLLQLCKLLGRAVGCKITDNIVGTLYSKMLINSCITSAALLSGQTLGRILVRRSGRKLFFRIISEGCAAASAAGIAVPPYKGKLDYQKLARKNLAGALYRAASFLLLGIKYGRRRSATLESLKAGARTETEFYNGYISRLGKKHGVPTPVNDAVCDIIAEIERDITLINPKNIAAALRGDKA